MDKYYKVSTKFGNVYLKPTSDSHIYVDASGSSHIEEGLDRHGPLKVNNVEMGVTAHFYKWSDEKWRIGKERADWSTSYHALYSLYTSCESARKKLTDELTTVVGNWVAQNPQALADASVEDLEAKLKKAEADLKEKQAEMDVLDYAVRQAKDALTLALRSAKDAVKEKA
jgi:hypothetical protein